MLPLNAEQKQVVGRLGGAAQLVAVLFLAAGVIQVVGGPVSWLVLGGTFLNGLFMLIQGALTAFLGLAMLAVSSDFTYLGQFPQYSANHVRNAAKNLTVFHQAQVGLAVLIGLVALLRLWM
jgi:hypothetical protein